MAYLQSLPVSQRSIIELVQKNNRVISLPEIANAFRIKIIHSKDIDGDGYLEYDENEDYFIIFVNDDRPEPRQRFTIAHEIAHYLLHSEYVKSEKQIDKGIRSGYEDYKETQANELAAEILLPLDEIDKAIGEGKNTLEKLSEEFHVSTDALKIRLNF